MRHGYLLEILDQDSEFLSIRTIIHQWVGHCLILNSYDISYLNVLINGDKHVSGIELAEVIGLASADIIGVIGRLKRILKK
jgi:hypothetical protein